MRTAIIRGVRRWLDLRLRQAASGETLRITARGKVVAELREPGALRAPRAMPPGLRRLVQAGLAVPGAPNDPRLYPDLSSRVAPGTVARLIDEDRDERVRRAGHGLGFEVLPRT